MISNLSGKLKTIKSFIFKLTVFLAVTFSIDFFVGTGLKILYFQQKGGAEFATDYAINKTTDDILIFGSSRALSIFNPVIFQNSLNLPCYNAGRNGYPLFYHYAVLKANLKRHTPKLVILSFDAGNFNNNQDSYDRLSSLLPYYENHPEIRPVIELKGSYEKLKMISSIYPYNSLIIQIISGNTEFSKKKYPAIKGFIPLVNEIKGPLIKIDYTKETKLDSLKLVIYKSFLQLCINSKVRIVVVCPPYMIDANGVDKSIVEGKRIAAEHNIEFFDYSNDTFYTKQPKLFYDYKHLNDNGVSIFSQKIADRIRMMDDASKEVTTLPLR